jgi:AcrR family transcriptional regulator
MVYQMSPDRKLEILDAAGKRFAQYGYEKTTLDDIAAIVGINKASFYYYFKNKEAIFFELITREADEYIQQTKDKAELIPGYRAKILAWVKESFRFNQTNSIFHQLSIESLKRVTPFLTELVVYTKRKGVVYLSSILNQYQETGEVHIEDPVKLAQTIIDVIYAMKDQLYRNLTSPHGEECRLDQKVEEILYIVSLVLNGIIVRETD